MNKSSQVFKVKSEVKICNLDQEDNLIGLRRNSVLDIWRRRIPPGFNYIKSRASEALNVLYKIPTKMSKL